MHLHKLLAVVAMAALVAESALDESQCETKCGDLTIPYPFGSSDECSYHPDFTVTCDHSSGESTLFLGPKSSNFVISNISMAGVLEITADVVHDCYNTSGLVNRTESYLTMGRRGENIRISTKNMFVAIGCDTHAFFEVTSVYGHLGATGCISSCVGAQHLTDGSCSGVGCCQVSVPAGLTAFNISLSSYNDHEGKTGFNPCSYAFFVEPEKFNFSTSYLHGFQNETPILLEWAIGNSTCHQEAKEDPDSFQCQGNSTCDLDYKGPGYRCSCRAGYEGNPYVGCTDINECESGEHGCLYTCQNEVGNYTCICPEGQNGDGRRHENGCSGPKQVMVIDSDQNSSIVIKIAVGSSAAAIFLIVFVNWLYFCLKKRKLMMLREKFFRQNGGIMLQQRISRDRSSHE